MRFDMKPAPLKRQRAVPIPLAACFLGAWIGLCTPVGAQNAPTLPTVSAPANLSWSALNSNQQTALGPLKPIWDSLADGHRRKWIALSQNYATMSPADRETLKSRMLEWAALKPKERQVARLNFAETKKTSAEERLANWEAYQALSQDEKDALARKGQVKPAGAAVAAKAPPPQKITPVPITRNSPEPQKERLAEKQLVDKRTLLPVAPAQKANSAN